MRLKKYRKQYNKLSSRLIAIISLIVVICFGVFTFNLSTSIAEAEFQRFEQNTRMLTQYVDREMGRIVNEIVDANSYYELSLMTSNTSKEEHDNILMGLQNFDDFTKSLFMIKTPDTNSTAEYYTLKNNSKLETLEVDFNVNEILTQYNQLSDYKTQFLYFDKQSKKLFNITKFYQVSSKEEILLGIELNSDIINELINDSDTKNFGNIGVASEDGTIILHNNESLIGKALPSLSIGEEISDALEELNDEIDTESNGFHGIKRTLNGPLSEFEILSDDTHTFMYLPIKLESHDITWGVIVDINDNQLKESSISIAKTIIIGGFLTLLTLIILIKIVVNRALKPIGSIMTVMKDVEEGNLNSRTSIASCNEMEVIGSQLNGLLDHMIDDRDSIVKQKNEIEELLIEVENLMQENDRIYYETIKSLAKTIDAKDPYTGGHCDRVTEYSLYIGKEMNLSAEELSSLTYGAMLHDIGKIGISESIITKEGRLTDEEFEAIKSHPEKGFEILKDIHFLKDARLGVLHHHERYDGRGYPHGLKATEIDLKARIIAIADAFDAMTSDRSYRKALSIEKAIEQLVTNKGIQFDPDMVDILLDGIDSNRVTL